LESLHTYLKKVARQGFLVRFITFLGLLAIAWAPLAIIILFVISEPSSRGTGLLVAVLPAFIGVLACWNRLIYGGSFGLSSYGLQPFQKNYAGLLLGWTIGGVSLLLLFMVKGWLGWLSWNVGGDVNLAHLGKIALEGFLVALAVALGEELLFRGWLLTELEQDYSPTISLWVSSMLFAIAHFIKPIEEVFRTFPQFPGLVLLGLILVWARRSQNGHLGLSIGLHGGLIWGYYLAQVGNLATIRDTAPELWTGIDQNPLAGGMGIISLSLIAIWVRQLGREKSSVRNS